MVICNKTLAEGVNFPVKTLVLGDIRSPKGKGFMPLDDLMNVIGRAGRAGKETYGMVIGNADKNQYILKAAKGEDLQPAKGQMIGLLENIEKAERDKGQELTDDEIKGLLDATGYAEKLDKMIMLSTEDFSLPNADAEALASSSLTYHLTSHQGQGTLRRVFNSRLKNLQGLSSDIFETYKKTGITPKGIEELSSRINNNLKWDVIEVDALCESNFITTMLRLSNFGEKEEKRRKYSSVLEKWMLGFTYKQIADEVGLSVDNTVNCIEQLTRDFLMESKAIIRYVCYRFNIENEAFGYWPIFVEKGLCTTTQAILCRKGLSDRIALHVVDKFIREETNWQILGDSLLRDLLLELLRGKRSELDGFLKRMGIPILAIERVDEFLININ